MSDREALTVGDFLVAFSKSQTENFAKVNELMIRHDTALNKVEVMLSELRTKIDTIQTPIESLWNHQQSQEVPPTIHNPIVDEVFQQDDQQIGHPAATSTPKSSVKREANEALFDSKNAVDVDLTPTTEDVPVPAHVKEHRKNDNRQLRNCLFFLFFSLEIYCFDCKKTFERGSGKFTQHVKKTTCRPYKCHCGKLFKKKSTLTAHKSIHSNATFRCHCGSVFRCGQYLKNHQRRKHQETPTSEAKSEPVGKRFRLSSPDDDVQEEDDVISQVGDTGNTSILDPLQLLRLQMFGEE